MSATKHLSNAYRPVDLVQIYVTSKPKHVSVTLKAFERYKLYKLRPGVAGGPVKGTPVIKCGQPVIFEGEGSYEHLLSMPGRYVLAYSDVYQPSCKDTRLSDVMTTEIDTCCGQRPLI